MLVDRGFAATKAAAISGVIGIASILGRLVTGLLLDRFNGPLVGAIGLGLPVVACLLLFSSGESTISTVVIAAIIGLSLGAETDVVAFLTARFFGLRHYGVLFGTLAGFLSLGTGLGPMLAGTLYDRFHSYDRAALDVAANIRAQRLVDRHDRQLSRFRNCRNGLHLMLIHVRCSTVCMKTGCVRSSSAPGYACLGRQERDSKAAISSTGIKWTSMQPFEESE